MSCLLGEKLGMTQVFTDKGEVVPVTVIQAGPCVITQIKTIEKDAYSAVQIGFKEKKEKKVNKAQKGLFEKVKTKPRYTLREVKVAEQELEKYEIGQELKVDSFEVGAKVDIIGRSKGRGYAGVMKRYNFKGTRSSHGQGGEYHRHGGSIGQCSYPARVFKGMKMPGHMGASRVTVQNLQIADIDQENNLLLIKGAVPGANGNLVMVSSAVKGKK